MADTTLSGIQRSARLQVEREFNASREAASLLAFVGKMGPPARAVAAQHVIKY
jgi:hypothetical protein